MSDITIGHLRGGLCVYWRGPDGKRVRHQLTSRNRKDAEAEARAIFARSAKPVAGLTVADVWAAYLVARSGRSVATTMDSTGKSILPHFGALQPAQISDADCLAYAAKRTKAGRSDGTTWTELGHLRTALSWAVKRRMISYAPEIIRPSKPAPKDRYLTHSEIDRLLSANAAPHIKLAILLMLSTAGRVSAILELTWDRVDLDRRVIRLATGETGPKKGRATVPINAGLLAALQTARQAALSDHVVEWASGPVRCIRRGFMSACQDARLDGVTLHTLRHSSAVHMAEAGIPMSEISQFMGHSNSHITERVYARYSPGHLGKAADVVDFTRVRSAK